MNPAVTRSPFREVTGLANGEHVDPMALPPPVLVGGKYSNTPPRHPCHWPGCPYSSVDYNELVRHVQRTHDNSRDNYLLARRAADRLRAPARPVAPVRAPAGAPEALRQRGTRLARTVA